MLFDGRPFVALPAVSDHGVLHEVEGDPALQIFWYTEDDLLITSSDEILHFFLLIFVAQLLILLEVALHTIKGTLYSYKA